MKDRQANRLAVLSVIISSVVIFAFFLASKEEFINLTEAKETVTTFAGVSLYNNLEIIAEERRIEIETELKQYLRILLPENAKESDVKIEADYVKRKMNIEISHVEQSYLETSPIVGSCNHIADINWRYEAGKAYIELELDAASEYTVSFEGEQLVVKFISPKEIYDKVIVVDAGHGGNHPGTNRNGILEKDITLDIVLYLKELLDKSDIKVYYTREDDSNPSFEERVQLANQMNADYFVSVHINADEYSRESNGTEVLYFTEDERSRAFAQLCTDKVSEALSSRNRGVSNGDSIYIVRSAKVPVALIEVGFISNNTEFKLLCNESYKRKAAEGIYQAILAAYENEKEN